MRKNLPDFDQLIFDTGEVVANKLLRKKNTVIWYRTYWRKMYRQLLAQGISEFTSTVGRQYLLDQFSEFDYASLPKKKKI